VSRGRALPSRVVALVPRNTTLIRRLALRLPEATEEVTWGDVNFRVRSKIFCFPGDTALTVKADPEELDALLGDPRFARAAYVGRFGWVTMQLAPPVDWDEVDELIRSSYCLVAPKKLAREAAASEPA
jgi:predicted DNA-binding protein (MmcQ/YjbR family)